MKKLFVLLTSLLVVSCSSDDTALRKEPKFTASNFFLDDYSVKELDLANNFITVQVPYGSDTKAMIATFHLDPGSKVYVGEVEQTSGETVNDFSMPIEYKIITRDGAECYYTIAVCYSDLPMIYIATEHGADVTSKESYLSGTRVIVCNSSEHNGIFSNAKIKGRGNSSWGMPKKSYTLKLDKKIEFMGLAKHKTFALIANYADKTLLRNGFAYQMGRDIYTGMAWNPSTRNVQLVLNGEYVGIYAITETIKIDKNRVDIPNMEECTSPDDANHYGFIVEVDARQDELFNFITTRNVPFSLKEPNAEDITEDLCIYIRQTVQTAEDKLYALDFDDYYGNYIDIDSFIDWYLVNEITKNNDAIFWSSCYMYFDPEDDKIHMGPLWDFDLAFGNIDYNGNDNPEGFWVKTSAWIFQMFYDADFVKKVKLRWAEKKSELLTFISVEIRNQCNALAYDADFNFSRWPILGTYVWPNAAGYDTRMTYQSEAEYLYDWIERRIEWLDKAIADL